MAFNRGVMMVNNLGHGAFLQILPRVDAGQWLQISQKVSTTAALPPHSLKMRRLGFLRPIEKHDDRVALTQTLFNLFNRFKMPARVCGFPDPAFTR